VPKNGYIKVFFVPNEYVYLNVTRCDEIKNVDAAVWCNVDDNDPNVMNVITPFN